MEIDGGASASAVALLGLDGFVVLSAAVIDDELHQLIEATAAVTGCGTCGVVASLHDRREVRVRDLPSGGRPVVLVCDPLYGIRRLLLRAAGTLDDHAWTRLHAGLDARARHGEVCGALLAKELLREVYAAIDLAHARRRLIAF